MKHLRQITPAQFVDLLPVEDCIFRDVSTGKDWTGNYDGPDDEEFRLYEPSDDGAIITVEESNAIYINNDGSFTIVDKFDDPYDFNIFVLKHYNMVELETR